MIKWLKSFRKQSGVPDEAETCKHDWEVVGHSNIWEVHNIHTISQRHTFKGYVRSTEYPCTSIYDSNLYERVSNRVCVLCGECDPAVSRAEAILLAEEKKIKKERRTIKVAKRRREAWAKQLWDDGCKGVVDND